MVGHPEQVVLDGALIGMRDEAGLIEVLLHHSGDSDRQCVDVEGITGERPPLVQRLFKDALRMATAGKQQEQRQREDGNDPMGLASGSPFPKGTPLQGAI